MPRLPRSVVLVLALGVASLSCHFGSVAISPPEGSDRAALVELQRELSSRPSGLVPEEIEAVARAILAECRRLDLSPQLVTAIIEVESSGYNFAMSSAGALGLMQIRPDTGAALAPRLGVPWRGPATLLDPVVNVRMGITYLRDLIDRFGSVERALAAYNWGPTRIAARIGRGQAVPSGYAKRVMAALAGQA